VATDGTSVIYGYGVNDDRNGPYTLVLEVDNTTSVIVLDTRVWKVTWDDREVLTWGTSSRSNVTSPRW